MEGSPPPLRIRLTSSSACQSLAAGGGTSGCIEITNDDIESESKSEGTGSAAATVVDPAIVQPQLLHTLFEQSASDHEACECVEDGPVRLSYGGVNDAANQVQRRFTVASLRSEILSRA